MSTEKFFLRWNDFETNISSAFRELRDDKDFFDVTIACDDEQLQAHKVILSACSPFFRNILRRNPHQHPLLFLKGVKYTDLQSVLNFMYHGEVNIAQEELNSFLAVAEDLKVKGLTQSQSGKPPKTPSPEFSSRKVHQPPTKTPARFPDQEPPVPIKRSRLDPPVQNIYTPAVPEDDDIQEVVQMPIKSEPIQPLPAAPVYTTHQPVALQEQVDDQSVETYQEDSQLYDDYGQYGDDQHYAAAGASLPGQGYEQGKGGEPDRSILLENIKKELLDGKSWYSCTLCGKENDPKMISDYLEKSPEYGPKAYQCKVCGKVSSDKSSASKHLENIHMPGGEYTYACKYC